MLRSAAHTTTKSSDDNDQSMDREDYLSRLLSSDKSTTVTKSCASLVVVEFSKKATQDSIDWLISKIQCPRRFGGGSLCVKSLVENGVTVLHVGAKIDTLLVAAELMELKKVYNDGLLREIQLDDLDQFKNTDELDHFLTQAEKQRIVKHELDLIRATDTDSTVPGAPKVKLYSGLAIVPHCMEEGLIAQIYPLHDKSELKALGHAWYSSFLTIQPIDRIQTYFGETIAMYFAFLGFYTMALLPPAIAGVTSEILRSQFEVATLDLIIFFSIFNLVWATIFLEAWKRNCSTLAYKWGTIHTEQYEEARPEYHGAELVRNQVTDRLEPKYPKWKRALKFYGVTVPVVLLCLLLAFVVMLWYFWLEDLAIAYHKEKQSTVSSALLFMPTIIYAVIIAVMNAIYRTLAKVLNDWENHRLQSAYENHLIVKLVLFDFTNCFVSLFYVAFYMQDLTLLRSHLAALLITQQILGQLQESLLPYLTYKWRKAAIIKKRSASVPVSPDKQPLHVGVEDISSVTCDQAEIEALKEQYLIDQAACERDMLGHDRGTLDDYLEMFIQFGYVFLFSAVFPTAAFYALINNITEIRTDAFKLCRIFQRPFSRPTSGIGAWQLAFEVMSVMAVLTNCALLALTPQVSKFVPEYGEVNILLFFVVAEHCLLFIKLALAYLIPDEPKWVETAIARTAYQSKLAWRRQRAVEAKQHLKNRPLSSQQAPDDNAPTKDQC